MLISGSIHAVVNAVLKSGGNRLVQISLSSGLGAVIMASAILFVPLPHGAWGWLFAANFIHLLYFYTLTRAFDSGDLSSAYPIFRGSAPMLTAFGATLIFREPLDWVQLAGILCIGGGMLAMVAGKHVARATLHWSLATGVLIAAYTVIDAQGVRAAPTAGSFIVWFFFTQGLFSLIVLPPFVKGHYLAAARSEWRSAVTAGSLSIVTFGLALYALSLGQTAPLAALRETGMVTALLISVFVLKEPVTRARAVSILAICAGAVLIVMG
jgi:drug/metabolite transporter (DMT)-like permease